MPRIKQYEERYAMGELTAELNAQRARFGLTSYERFGTAIGVSGKGAWNLVNNPDAIRLGVFRQIVKAVKPDPGVLLKALGYTTQDIKKLAKEYA